MAAGDRQRLTCLMGDFHIRIAELCGNAVLIEMLRDLTARTILISMLYQSEFHAAQSHQGHCRIFEAMVEGDFVKAAELSIEHLDEVETGLDLTARPDPLSELRISLSLPPKNAPSTSRLSGAKQPVAQRRYKDMLTRRVFLQLRRSRSPPASGSSHRPTRLPTSPPAARSASLSRRTFRRSAAWGRTWLRRAMISTWQT